MSQRSEQCIREGTPEQYLAAALQAAINIMRGDNNQTSSYLARFWGPNQDRALTALFGAAQSSRANKELSPAHRRRSEPGAKPAPEELFISCNHRSSCVEPLHRQGNRAATCRASPSRCRSTVGPHSAKLYNGAADHQRRQRTSRALP